MRKNAPEKGEVVRLMIEDHPTPTGSRRSMGIEMLANFIVVRVWAPPFANVCTVREIGRDGQLLPAVDLYWPDWSEDVRREAEEQA
jgi:hypothetical protein